MKASDRVQVLRLPAAQLLGRLPDGSVDVVITDPPYVTVDRRPNGGHLRTWFRGGLTWVEIRRILAVARRKLKRTGMVFVMTNSDGLREALAALERAGFVRIRTLTWDRRWPGLGGGLRHRTEFVLLGRLPGSRTVTGTDLIAVSAVGPGTAHRYVTEKPEGLGRALARIAGVGPGDLVVDPFCGSGALLVGAADRGASVIGGDISAVAVRRATGRLHPAAVRGPAAARGPATTKRRTPHG